MYVHKIPFMITVSQPCNNDSASGMMIVTHSQILVYCRAILLLEAAYHRATARGGHCIRGPALWWISTLSAVWIWSADQAVHVNQAHIHAIIPSTPLGCALHFCIGNDSAQFTTEHHTRTPANNCNRANRLFCAITQTQRGNLNNYTLSGATWLKITPFDVSCDRHPSSEH